MIENVVKMTRSKKEEFMELVQTHHRELLVYARAITGEGHLSKDIAQDSFVVAWNNFEKFDVSKNFPSWLRGIVRNKWKEHLRRSKRQVALDDDVLEIMEVQMLSWDQLRTDGGAGVFIKLEACVSKLPEALAEVVKLFYYDESSTEEAAAKTDSTGAAVRKRLERARTALKECLKK